MSPARSAVDDALRVLGIQNLVLGIHDPAFPSAEDEDVGRGSPYSGAADGFLELVRKLGFTGIQLGPQGQTSKVNPSPYDGTIFSRSALSVAGSRLVEDGLVTREELESLVSACPAHDARRAQYGYAFDAQERMLRRAYQRFRERRASDPRMSRLDEKLAAFRQRHRPWLERDGLFHVLTQVHSSGNWREWREGGVPHPDQRLWAPADGERDRFATRRRELATAHETELEYYAFTQLLAHQQHAGLRERVAKLPLKLYGDLQIGFSHQDQWSYQSTFMRGYWMGAPPSRTNPEGQPWNYPVLDPDQYFSPNGEPGPALELLNARMRKMLAEFDGVRLDHPHGLVCPWVYHSANPDALWAVQHGARLFDSPDLPDHPELARLAIPTPPQINRSVPRYADDWVQTLTTEQVQRYSVLFNAIVEAAKENSRQVADLVCEVLSTLPFPLRRVMAQCGLGRFRVTQKANLLDPKDVYRSENAARNDWVMVGNHDTRPLWAVARGWQAAGALGDHAEHLSRLLIPEPEARSAFVARLSVDLGLLVQAKFAELFQCRAENVMIFFTDLFGDVETYNSPGTVSDDNWSLRVPRDYEAAYVKRRSTLGALNLPFALAMAIRSRGAAFSRTHAALLAALDSEARST